MSLKKTILVSLTFTFFLLSLFVVFKKDQKREILYSKKDPQYENLLRNDQTALATELAKAGQFALYRFLEQGGPIVVGIKCKDYKDIGLIDVPMEVFLGETGHYYSQRAGEMRTNARAYNLAVYNQPNFPLRKKCSIKGP